MRCGRLFVWHWFAWLLWETFASVQLLLEKSLDLLKTSGVVHLQGLWPQALYNMSVSSNGKSQADKTFPLEAGETVRIYATYSPDDASVDFGLIDPDGIFHYFNVTDGTIDKTIEIAESGNYRLAVKNNSSKTVKISGFRNILIESMRMWPGLIRLIVLKV